MFHIWSLLLYSAKVSQLGLPLLNRIFRKRISLLVHTVISLVIQLANATRYMAIHLGTGPKGKVQWLIKFHTILLVITLFLTLGFSRVSARKTRQSGLNSVCPEIGSIMSKGSQNMTGSTFLKVWEDLISVDQV